MVRRIASLVVLAGAVSVLPSCTTEPPLDVAPDVDLSRFQGKWYEIARLPRMTETDCFGTTAFYDRNTDGSLRLVHQCNVGSATGPLDTVSMTATVPKASIPAKMSLQVAGYAGDYWILEVGPNYEYAVIGHPSRSYFWILGRTPGLDPATMQGVLQRAESQHFDTSQLVFTPQPPAGELATATAPVGPIPPALSTGCSVSPRAIRGTGGAGGAASAALAFAMLLTRVRGRRR